MKAATENGILYVLTNEAMPGYIKIGMTTRPDVKTRLKELRSTGVPCPFECVFACRTSAEQCEKLESSLHKAFDNVRVKGREFFRMDPCYAISVLDFLCDLTGFDNVTDELCKEMSDSMTSDDKAALEVAKRARRKNMDFIELGLAAGDLLTFTRDANIKCSVVDGKAVCFDGSNRSLTSVTRDLVGYTCQPAPFWRTQSGATLLDLYETTYNKE